MKKFLSILLVSLVCLSVVGCVKEKPTATISISPIDKAFWSTVSISDNSGDSPFGSGIIVGSTKDYITVLAPCYFKEKSYKISTIEGKEYKIGKVIEHEKFCLYQTETPSNEPLQVAYLNFGSVDLGDRIFSVAYGSNESSPSAIRLYSEYVINGILGGCTSFFLLTDPAWEFEGTGLFDSSGYLIGMVEKQAPVIF
jgi:hypothetical protein